MKCPTCLEENERSEVYPGPSMSTLMAYSTFYDEDGVRHNHDPNTITVGFVCSRGHEWTERTKTPCPNCDYNEKN